MGQGLKLGRRRRSKNRTGLDMATMTTNASADRVAQQRQHGVLIGAIDQGTSSSRFLVFDPADETTVVAQAQKEFDSKYPREGWAEQDPELLVSTVKDCIASVHAQLKEAGLEDKLSAVGITNQRETTVVWDRTTGEPLHDAVVWLDARTQATVEALVKKAKGDKDVLRSQCGLPLSTYFSAVKVRSRWKNKQNNLSRIRILIKTVSHGSSVGSWTTWRR